MPPVDLHIHSLYSDGVLSPATLVAMAQQAGFAAISITDHDTTAGLDDALIAGRAHGVEVLPGIEISVREPEVSLHILGYGVDHHNPALREGIARTQAIRKHRNDQIFRRLSSIGLHFGEDEAARFGLGAIGRPHIARMLVERGVVRNQEEAFARFLRRGRPAYVPKDPFPAADAIAMVRAAGGLAFLAHPGLLPLSGEETARLVGNLHDQGLHGLEVYYPKHGPETIHRLHALRKTFNLLASGGSDFHDAAKGETFFPVAFDAYEPIRQALAGHERTAEVRPFPLGRTPAPDAA